MNETFSDAFLLVFHFLHRQHTSTTHIQPRTLGDIWSVLVVVLPATGTTVEGLVLSFSQVLVVLFTVYSGQL